jgi:hypothetical protein
MPAVPTLPTVTTDTVVAALQSRLSSAIVPSGGLSPFWTLTELQLYSVEAARIWNALAQWSRQRLAFSTTPVSSTVTAIESQWYDLSSEFPAQLGYNLTDYYLTTLLQYHLLEPAAYPAWSGTPMFEIDDIFEAIQRRRDQFILESLQVLSILDPAAPGPSGRMPISNSTLDVRRASWQDVNSGQWTNLWRSNEFAAQAFSPEWDNQPGPPQAYSVATSPDFTVQIIPAPANSGNVQLVIAAAGAAPTIANFPPGNSLGIPDDFVWVLKFGVLADLLSMDGPARDPQRAQYCEQRWQQGIKVARLSSSVLGAQLAAGSILLSSVFGIDSFNPGWVNASPGPPQSVAMMGYNLLAVDTPSDVQYGISIDAVTNARLPTSPTGYVATPLPVGRDALDVIVDVAELLACFKMGGAEFEAIQPAWDRMLRLATVYNERIKAIAEPAIYDRRHLQANEVPARISA